MVSYKNSANQPKFFCSPTIFHQFDEKFRQIENQSDLQNFCGQTQREGSPGSTTGPPDYGWSGVFSELNNDYFWSLFFPKMNWLSRYQCQ